VVDGESGGTDCDEVIGTGWGE